MRSGMVVCSFRLPSHVPVAATPVPVPAELPGVLTPTGTGGNLATRLPSNQPFNQSTAPSARFAVATQSTGSNLNFAEVNLDKQSTGGLATSPQAALRSYPTAGCRLTAASIAAAQPLDVAAQLVDPHGHLQPERRRHGVLAVRAARQQRVLRSLRPSALPQQLGQVLHGDGHTPFGREPRLHPYQWPSLPVRAPARAASGTDGSTSPGRGGLSRASAAVLSAMPPMDDALEVLPGEGRGPVRDMASTKPPSGE